MIKHIVFDLDGVLIDTREMHFYALNKALEKHSYEKILKEEHLKYYDGLPTNKKLELLTKYKNLPVELHSSVWNDKQKYTKEYISDFILPDTRIISILKKLKEEGYSLSVASNSIKDTVKNILLKKGYLEYIDFYLSNEDVVRPKPSSEMLLKTMINARVEPKECLVVEDSNIGKKAVSNSGAWLCSVLSADDLSYEKIKITINMANETISKTKAKWSGSINVLVPMAGAGTRFERAGYTFPKPLIEVRGKPMIQVVVDNLNIEGTYTFIVQKSHFEKYSLKNTLELIAPKCNVVTTEGITQGAACTVLLAKEFINNNSPLILANSDQFVDWDSNEFMWSMLADNVDGGILVFESTHPKWSFAKVDENNHVLEVAEKNPISNLATAGIYFWKRGSDFVKYAEQMIAKNVRVNNEFYVCPVFNEAILDNKKIKIFKIKNKNMWGLGTPEDLNYFLENHNENYIT